MDFSKLNSVGMEKGPTAKPWSLDHPEWKTCVTNGTCALFLREEHEGTTKADMATQRKLLSISVISTGVLPNSFGQPGPNGKQHKVDFAELSEWVGPVPTPEPCENCGGDGQCNGCHCEHVHVCGECQGTGVGYPQSNPGRLFGALVDRTVLSPYIAAVQSVGDVVVTVGETIKPICIDGDGWRIILMPLNKCEGAVDVFEASLAGSK